MHCKGVCSDLILPALHPPAKYKQHSHPWFPAGFQGERPVSYRQPNGRALSDRELVEQTSSLKLRSGAWAGEGLPQDPTYHTSSQRRNGERGFGGRSSQSRGGNRRPGGGQQRTAPANPRVSFLPAPVLPERPCA